MTEQKMKKLLRLYEAMGDIDPSLAANARDYRCSVKGRTLRLCVVLAACIVLFAAMMIVGVNIALGGAKSEDRDNMLSKDSVVSEVVGGNSPETPDEQITRPAHDVTTTAPESTGMLPIVMTVESILKSSENKALTLDEAELSSIINKEKVSIIWRDTKGVYYFVEFEKSEETDKLIIALSTSSANSKFNGNASVIRKLWVSLGDGTVVTPYLEYNESNVSNGKIFDYEPSICPSAEFAQILTSLLEKN